MSTLRHALGLAMLAAPAAAQVAPGFTLIHPNDATSAYLIDEAGVVVQEWASGTLPGNALTLLPDGDLLQTAQVPGASSIGGFGGRVMRMELDGTIVWDFELNDASQLQHHDAIPMPGGTVLMLAFDKKTAAEAIAAGRDPATIAGNRFWGEKLVEVLPTGPTTGVVVWEWRLWDHLIQDHDPTKANFGVVADHPELFDVNFPPDVVGASGDWLHANAIDYDPVRDQVLIGFPWAEEFIVVDHSTTTAEAAGHTGGGAGQGGDILYRWGNPQSYGAGTAADQQLFNFHGAMFIEPGRPGEGNVILFNNQVPGPTHSEVWELERQPDVAGGYALAPGGSYGPAGPIWSYAAPNPTDLFSPFLSGAHRLVNGNTLICEGVPGILREVTLAGQEIWVHQNVLPNPGQPRVFQARRHERFLWVSEDELSIAAGGTVQFDTIGGTALAGDLYILLGSATGTAPALPLPGGLELPLVVDAYFSHLLASPNQPPFSQTLGTLDALGRASSTLAIGPGQAPPSLAGATLHHAVVALDLGSGEASLSGGPCPLPVVP